MTDASDKYKIEPIHEGLQRVVWSEELNPKQPGSLAEVLFMDLEHHASLTDHPRKVEIDLSHCLVADSRGIAMLVILNRRFKGCNTNWCIVDPPLIFVRMLRLLNLDKTIDFRFSPDSSVDHQSEKPTQTDESNELKLTDELAV